MKTRNISAFVVECFECEEISNEKTSDFAAFCLLRIDWACLCTGFSEGAVKVSERESILACGGSVDPRYSLILQPQSGDMQGVEGLAKSLHLGETPISYRECAYEQGKVLVVDNLTEDEVQRLRRVFEGNIRDIQILIHQRINLPFQSI